MPKDSTETGIVPHPLSTLVRAGLRSVAASVPIAASLGQLWSEYETRRTNKRIEELFRNLERELVGLRLTIRDQADGLRGCDDFPELLEIAIEKVRREFDETKRSRYAHLLVQLIAGGEARSHDEKVTLLDSLDMLSKVDLRVLFLFEGKEEAQIADLRWREIELGGDVNNQLWELACSLARLESRGLIFKTSLHAGGVYIQAPFNADTARWVMTKYRLLPLGKSLIAVLSG